MTTLTSQQLLHILYEDTYYAIPHSINAWLNSLKLKHSTKLVAQTLISQVIIRSRNNDKLLIRVSKSLLSELTGVGIRTIPSCIRELSQHGVITIHDTTPIGTLYEIHIDTQCMKFIRHRKTSRTSQNGTPKTNDCPNPGQPESIMNSDQTKSKCRQSSQPGTETKSINYGSTDDVANQITLQEKSKHDHMSQFGTTSKHIEGIQNRDTNKTETIQNHEAMLSQVGIDTERQNLQDIDSEVKALGFDSKEKMFLALTFHRLGKRKLDAEIVEQMEQLEERMMQSINQSKDKQTKDIEQRKKKANMSQSGTHRNIKTIRNDKDPMEKNVVPNRDKGPVKNVATQIKLRKSQVKGIMTRMQKLSDRIPLWREIALEIIWAIEKGRIGKKGMTTFHRINAAVKLVRENRWRTPAGYKPMEVGHAIFA